MVKDYFGILVYRFGSFICMFGDESYRFHHSFFTVVIVHNPVFTIVVIIIITKNTY